MSRGKRPKGASFDLNIALYMADNYMRTADRAVKELPPEGVSERQTPSAGPLYLAISSLSFSLEIYFKAIVFAAQERTLEGHDLERLWSALPEAAQTWLSQNFGRNYVPTGREWSIHLRWSPFLTGTSHEADVRTPGLSALDMVKGHRLAFTVARYGYELPAASRLDLILYNVPGLQLVCWLARTLAYYLAHERDTARKASTPDGGRHTISLPLPTGPIARFPDELSAV